MKNQKDFESKLPKWKLTKLGGNKLGIECPRKDCEGKAIVDKRKWLGRHPGPLKTKYRTHTCTYCFKTSAIPEPEETP